MSINERVWGSKDHEEGHWVDSKDLITTNCLVFWGRAFDFDAMPTISMTTLTCNS